MRGCAGESSTSHLSPLTSHLSPSEGPVVLINFWRDGGMKHYAESLVQALRGAAPVFYLRNYAGTTDSDGLVLDVDFNPLRPRNWAALVRLARLLRALRPRAVHLNNEQPLLLPLYPLLARMNAVVTLHDARSHEGERLAKRLFHRLHLRLVRAFIPKIVVHSSAIRDALPPWLPRERIHIVPHVNFNHWALRPAALPPAEPVTVLFFGRILAYKGLDVLLESFRLLDAKHFHLIVAGEGEMPPVTGGNIEVRNRFVSDEEMAQLFQRAHLVALPYRAASQSGVAHMAFAFGKPVVSTRVGALPDVVRDGETGLLVTPGSAPELAAALEKLADPALRAQFEENIRRRNLSSDEEIRTALLAVYDA